MSNATSRLEAATVVLAAPVIHPNPAPWKWRRVKLAEFGNCSPAVHRYSLYGLLALLYLFVLSLLVPWPLSPAVALVLIGLDSVREWAAGEYASAGVSLSPSVSRQASVIVEYALRTEAGVKYTRLNLRNCFALLRWHVVAGHYDCEGVRYTKRNLLGFGYDSP